MSSKFNKPAANTGKNDTKKKGGDKPKSLLITPRSLTSLSRDGFRVDEVLRKILVDLECKIDIALDGDNTIVRVLDPKDKAIGSLADIAKVANFRNEIQKFMKNSESDAFMEPIRYLVNTLADEAIEKGKRPVALSESAKALLRDCAIKLDRVVYNLDLLLDWSTMQSTIDDEICATIMMGWCTAAYNILMGVVRKIVVGEDTRSYITEECFKQHVPKWGYDKVTSIKIDSLSTTQVYSILFPENAEKMRFTMTALEMSSTEFCQSVDIGYLLCDSKYQISVLRDGNLLKLVTGAEEEVDFANEVDPVGNQLKGEKITVTPPGASVEKIFTKDAIKFKSYSNGSNFTTAKNGLAALLEAGLAFQTGSFRSGDNVANYYAPLNVTGIDYVKEIKARKGLRPAIEKLTEKPEFAKALMENFHFKGDAKDRFKVILPVFLGLKADHAIVKAIGEKIETFVSIDSCDLIRNLVKEEAKPKDASPDQLLDLGLAALRNAVVVEHHAGDVKADWTAKRAKPDGNTANENFLTRIHKMGLGKKPKAKSSKIVTGELTTTAKTLIKLFRDAGGQYEAVADSLSDWLRTMGSAHIQAFAAKLIIANFDTAFNLEEEDDDDDGQGNGGPSDPEDPYDI